MRQILLKLSNQIQKYDIQAAQYLNQLILKIAAQIDDLILQYPQYEAELRMVQRSDIKPAFLKWVIVQLERKEPIDEIINMIGEFEKNKQRLEKRDLYQYQSLGELRGIINDLGLSRRQQKLKVKKDVKKNIEGQYDILYDDGEFLVVYPHSKGASCYFGQGTQWCVAATTSKNYFNTYSSRNIFLYYILSRNPNHENPNMEKIAYSYSPNKGYDDYGEENNYMLEIFDATDQRIDEDDVYNYLGQKFQPIKSAILSNLNSQKENKYLTNINNIDLEGFIKLKSEMDSEDVVEFTNSVLENTKNPKLIEYIYNNINPITYTLENIILKNQHTPPQVLDSIFENIEDKNSFNMQMIRSFYKLLLSNSNLSSETIDKITQMNLSDFDDFILEGILYHPNTKPEIREKIIALTFKKYEGAKSIGKRYQFRMMGVVKDFARKFDFNLQPELSELLLLNGSVEELLMLPLAQNKNLPDKTIKQILNIIDTYPNPSKDNDEMFDYIIKNIATKKNLSAEIVKQLIEQNAYDEGIAYYLSENIVLQKYPDLLWELAKHPDRNVRWLIASSKYTYTEILLFLTKDPDEEVANMAGQTLHQYEDLIP